MQIELCRGIVFCSKEDEVLLQTTAWISPGDIVTDTKDHMLCDSVYMECPEKARL